MVDSDPPESKAEMDNLTTTVSGNSTYITNLNDTYTTTGTIHNAEISHTILPLIGYDNYNHYSIYNTATTTGWEEYGSWIDDILVIEVDLSKIDIDIAHDAFEQVRLMFPNKKIMMMPVGMTVHKIDGTKIDTHPIDEYINSL